MAAVAGSSALHGRCMPETRLQNNVLDVVSKREAKHTYCTVRLATSTRVCHHTHRARLHMFRACHHGCIVASYTLVKPYYRAVPKHVCFPTTLRKRSPTSSTIHPASSCAAYKFCDQQEHVACGTPSRVTLHHPLILRWRPKSGKNVRPLLLLC